MPKAEALVLDTHVWINVALGRLPIAPRVAKKIDAAAFAGALYISAITPWEVASLVAHGKLKLNAPTFDWVTRTMQATRVIVAPLEPVIAVDSVELPLFHGDPADRIIVATTRHLAAVLVTRDGKILEYAESTKNVRALEP